MYKSILFLFLSLVFSSMSWSKPVFERTRFTKTSDLGTVVWCPSGETHLLSVVEAKMNSETLVNFRGKNYQEKFANFVGSQVAPFNAHAAQHLIDFASHPNFISLTDYSFPLVNTETVILPKGCEHRQLAIIGDDHNYLDKDTFDLLPANEQAMFLFQVIVQLRRDLVRHMFSDKPHLLSTYMTLGLLNEGNMTLQGEFLLAVQNVNAGTNPITTSSSPGSLETNFGKLTLSNPVTVQLEEQGIFSLRLQQQEPVKVQGQDAFIYANNQFHTIYFHPTGEICGADVQIYPPPTPALKLQLTSGETVLIDGWGYIGFDVHGRAIEIPGTVTPLRDQNEIARYCQAQFDLRPNVP